ncbi:hypothetical protein PSEUDO8Z_90034 [Pseudomonas sp. 8Z]|uniref:hypothetical protein n=1 Tax=Pseudomonas sp. 8Z TaxID=2653166 RepID=UPI0012EFF1E4|nr:hypothetical protein [Pseudomonas sp. 8Z]VXD04705.1 hypothetical protein PSEUDO8Z_90034 [Pseudomonas sp. 8Z]
MPSKKTPAIKAKKELPEIPKELVEHLLLTFLCALQRKVSRPKGRNPESLNTQQRRPEHPTSHHPTHKFANPVSIKQPLLAHAMHQVSSLEQ